MMRLAQVHWITDTQREILAVHHCTTLAQLASLELADSMADAIPIDGLRGLARRARMALGRTDPMTMLGAAAGQRGPVRYAGGVQFEGTKDG